MNGIDELGDDARTVPKLIQDAQETLDWARGLGARVSDNNWVRNIINRMERILAEPSDAERRKKLMVLYKDVVESQHNVSDLIHLGFIRRHIGEQDPPVLASKLGLVLRGPDSVRQETSGNTGSRDARFELSTCARLNERGYSAELADPNPDIWAKRKGARAAIECKRILSRRRLEKRLLDARRQLRDRPASRVADLKVIYCDVTRVFTNGKLHLQGETTEVIKELEGKMRELAVDVQQFLEKQQIDDVDVVVLTYQDYIEPQRDDYVLRGITHNEVVINCGLKRCNNPNATLVPRSRRRLALRFFKKLDRSGKVHYEDNR